MKKKIMNKIAVILLFFIISGASYAQGAKIVATVAGSLNFDPDGWLTAVDDLYAVYDLVNNTITTIENQYKTIQQAIERAKTIDWENIQFDGDFDIRDDIKDANKRVNALLNEVRTVKETLTTPSIKCGNVSYSIADLCGVTSNGSSMWESRKNIYTAMKDYKSYLSNTMQKVVDDMTGQLTTAEKKAIAKKYGISPQNFALINNAHSELMKSASYVIGKASEEAKKAACEEIALKQSAIYQAVTSTTDSEGNPTSGAMQQGTFMTMQEMWLETRKLNDCVYTCAEMAAKKLVEDQAKQDVIENEKQQDEIQELKERKVSSRIIKNPEEIGEEE